MDSIDPRNRARAHRPPSCLRRWRSVRSPRLRLACLPWCGAGAGVYRRLIELLPPTVDALAVQLPGREDRYGDPPWRRMHAVVEPVLDELVALCDLPMAIFGHSMGAVVAHELARGMRSRVAREPDLLVLSGHGAPTLMQWHDGPWHQASDEALLRHLGAMGGTPEAVLRDRSMMRSLLPALRADYEVLETYRCADAEPLRCPLIVCAGTHDEAVSASSLDAWRALSSGPGSLHWFEGGHFYLRDHPQRLAAQLAAWLHRLVPARVTPA